MSIFFGWNGVLLAGRFVSGFQTEPYMVPGGPGELSHGTCGVYGGIRPCEVLILQQWRLQWFLCLYLPGGPLPG